MTQDKIHIQGTTYVVVSIVEGEYIAAAGCATHAVWLGEFLMHYMRNRAPSRQYFVTSLLLHFTQIQSFVGDRNTHTHTHTHIYIIQNLGIDNWKGIDNFFKKRNW